MTIPGVWKKDAQMRFFKSEYTTSIAQTRFALFFYCCIILCVAKLTCINPTGHCGALHTTSSNVHCTNDVAILTRTTYRVAEGMTPEKSARIKTRAAAEWEADDRIERPLQPAFCQIAVKRIWGITLTSSELIDAQIACVLMSDTNLRVASCGYPCTQQG